MKCLSLDEATSALGADIAWYVDSPNWRYPDPVPSYFLPEDSGAKVALSRKIANKLLERGPTVLWITQTGVWPSSEHIELFDRSRLSYGEARTMSDAPVHLFEPPLDTDMLTSVLYMGLAFVWDVELFTVDRSVALTISHDECIEYRFAPGQESFISEFQQWIAPSLRAAE